MFRLRKLKLKVQKAKKKEALEDQSGEDTIHVKTSLDVS